VAATVIEVSFRCSIGGPPSPAVSARLGIEESAVPSYQRKWTVFGLWKGMLEGGRRRAHDGAPHWLYMRFRRALRSIIVSLLSGGSSHVPLAGVCSCEAPMHTWSLTVLMPLVCLVLACGHDGDGEPGSSCGNFKVINGQECSRKDIPTVRIDFALADGRGALCTGTVIGQDFVLTAAHCLDLEGIVSATIVHDNGVAAAGALVLNPLFRASGATPQYDVGVLQVPGIQATLRIDKARIGVSEPVAPDDLLTFIGYGEDNEGNAGSRLPHGNPRVTDLKVIDVGNSVIATRFEASNSNTCAGDSGGAAYKNRTAVGVQSAGFGEVHCREGGFNTLADLRSAGNMEFLKQVVPDVEFQ
jgi:Trypsin